MQTSRDQDEVAAVPFVGFPVSSSSSSYSAPPPRIVASCPPPLPHSFRLFSSPCLSRSVRRTKGAFQWPPSDRHLHHFLRFSCRDSSAGLFAPLSSSSWEIPSVCVPRVVASWRWNWRSGRG
ncbi:hypothetical protein ACJRO7_003765 [Eucalyptus globulus]|uniref:Uncharacterized protein n=1 Tax=Eucalyptus globulus TaxID=34317 RepID=A0ABD3IWV0_EUCGL